MPRIIDISHTLDTGISVWEGDTAFQTFWVARMEGGASCNVGSVRMSLHTGTHADAPYHFQCDGAAMAEISLDAYIGPAEVYDITGTRVITAEIIERHVKIGVERALFRTQTADIRTFTPEFAHFAPDAAKALVRVGVKLVGVDTPSVDKSDSQALDSHKTFAAGKVALLENLNLRDVFPGRYELIALPLKLAGMDASPVRAVLREID